MVPFDVKHDASFITLGVILMKGEFDYVFRIHPVSSWFLFKILEVQVFKIIFLLIRFPTTQFTAFAQTEWQRQWRRRRRWFCNNSFLQVLSGTREVAEFVCQPKLVSVFLD